MARKKVRNKLKESEYWEWRVTLEEKDHAQTKLELASKKYAIMEKDIEILKLKALIYKQTVKSHKDVLDAREKEAVSFKLKLEDNLGQSLSNKTIKEDFSIAEID